MSKICCTTKLLTGLAVAALFASGLQVAQAHLRDPNVPPCFEMRDERVVPLTDTSSSNFVTFLSATLSPANQQQFNVDERLNVIVELDGQLCSPYYVYIVPLAAKNSNLIQHTSPSPVYAPGSIRQTLQRYVTFVLDAKRPTPNATASVTKIRLVVAQYGSEKQLAQFEIPLDASWRAPKALSFTGVPEYECIKDMHLPKVVHHAPRCSNSMASPNESVPLDLDSDGICERVVRDALCDKTHGNQCYRIKKEHNGDWQPIIQFYNQLKIHASTNGHLAVSSDEYGPLSNVTRFSEWQAGGYITHNYLHDCTRLPAE